MLLTRLLVVALIACSAPAFTQVQTRTEPWIVIAPADVSSGQDPSHRLRIDQFKVSSRLPGYEAGALNTDSVSVFSSSDGLDLDATCYAIRSYVVARDAKDSDSTHASGYSTCQPASRFRVKKAVVQWSSTDR